MKTIKSILLILLILPVFHASKTNNKLTEDQAKKAGEYMITIENQKRDEGAKINLIEWTGFLQSNETNAELRARVIYQSNQACPMDGKFNFIRSNDGIWILDSYDFRGWSGGSCFWVKENILYNVSDN